MYRYLLAALASAALPTGGISLDESSGEGVSDLAYYTSEEVIAGAESARLAYIELLDVPWVRDGGTRKWDLASGPDLALVVRTADGYELAESDGPAVSDVTQSAFPLTFEVSDVPFAEVGAEMVLYVSDYDRTGSDLMFRTAPFAASAARAEGRISAPIRTWTGTVIGTAYFEFEGWGPQG